MGEPTEPTPGSGPLPDNETLSAYVDGQVSPSERREIEDLVTTCERCRDEIADLFAVIALLGGVDDVASPRSFRLEGEFRRSPKP